MLFYLSIVIYIFILINKYYIYMLYIIDRYLDSLFYLCFLVVMISELLIFLVSWIEL